MREIVIVSFTDGGRQTAIRLKDGLTARTSLPIRLWPAGEWFGDTGESGTIGEERETGAIDVGRESGAIGIGGKDSAIGTGGENSRRADLRQTVRGAFSQGNGLIFVGAAGIAVRLIAPLIRDKREDPAVLVIDEAGRFVIPLLCGHIGGANELALLAASVLGAQAVITTATDLHGLFAVDVFARENGLVIEDMEAARRISAAVLRGERIGFFSDFLTDGPAPPELTPGVWQRENICITRKKRPAPPGSSLLRLLVCDAVIGMGCRRSASLPAVRQAAGMALEQAGLCGPAIRALATADRKREEPALLALAAERNLAFLTFTPQELSQAEGSFAESAFVKSVVGVGNLCERAAVLGCGPGGARLLLKKTVFDGVTAAVAVPARDRRIEWKKKYSMWSGSDRETGKT